MHHFLFHFTVLYHPFSFHILNLNIYDYLSKFLVWLLQWRPRKRRVKFWNFEEMFLRNFVVSGRRQQSDEEDSSEDLLYSSGLLNLVAAADGSVSSADDEETSGSEE